MYTRGGLGSLMDQTARFFTQAELRSYIGNDPQTTFYFREAVAAGLVQDSAEGERKFSVMWTARTEDLLRAGEWRFRAWKYFEWLAWSVTAGLVDGKSGLSIVPRGTFTSAAAAVQAAQTQLASDVAKYRLSGADAQAAAAGWVYALALSWPWGAQSVDAQQLLPAVPMPIQLVSPAGEAIITPITERSPLPTPVVVIPSGASSAPVPPPPGVQTMTPQRGGSVPTPVLDFGGGSSESGNGVTSGAGGNTGMLLLLGGAALLFFAGRKRGRR